MRIQLEAEDYLKANYLHLFHTSLSMAFLIVNLIMLVNGLCLGLVYLLSGQWWWILLSIFFIITSSITLVNLLALPRRTAKIFNQQKELNQPFDLQILDEGLSVISAVSETMVPWGDFHEWREDDDYLTLYLSLMAFIIIPKRTVEDPAVLDQIKQSLIDNGVEQNKRNKKDMNQQYKTGAFIYGALFVVIALACVFLLVFNIFG